MRPPRSSRPVRALTLAAALLLLLAPAACSDDDGDDAGDDGDAATSTTAGDDDDAGSIGADATLTDLAARGPHGVGSLTLDLDGRRVAVWYPAVEGAGTDEPTDTFDITGLLSPELQAQVPADARVVYPIAAAAGAEPDTDAGPYPVVLFSHGFAGFPEQSVDLTTHLASWGYVVAAPDHVERSLSGLLGTAAQSVEASPDDAVLSATLDLLVESADDDGSPLTDLLDDEKVAVAGHSAGASAAWRTAAADDRVDAFASLSLGGGGDEGRGAAPTVPGLVMLGDADETIPADVTQAAYDELSPPRYLMEIADAGHLVFSDICLIGAEQGGVVGIVETIGLDIPDDLLRLASDGCGDEDPPVTDAFPAIDSVTVAFLRAHLGGDEAAADLLVSGPVEAGNEAEVTLTADPG